MLIPGTNMLTRTARPSRVTAAVLVAALALAGSAQAEWTHWRGPHQNGIADDTGLIASWSQNGENLLWRDDFVGRSTPVVFDGRVCAIGRLGEGIERQEGVACWNAEDGTKLWQRGYNVYHTDVPWQRVGWANLAADSDTGYVFVHTVDGLLTALDRDGKTVWEHFLHEDHGRLSGYGGRTHTPIVDENLVILSAIGSSWGSFKPPRHRYWAFDKRTGEVVYVSNSSGPPAGDLNTQSTPVVAFIDGQRLLISGNTDGFVHAVQARTGNAVWKYRLSQRGLNVSVAVADGTVYASHSEENLDTGTMGRTVALDAKTGDERWRSDTNAGFPSPLVYGSRVYITDNAGNLHALDAKTGENRWSVEVGTVGKGSPVWADGRIYLTEVNGHVAIIEPGDDAGVVLDKERIEMPAGDRAAEIYASPAIAYGRIYFTTEEGIYCLGDKSKPFARGTAPATVDAATGSGPATTLLVVPAEVIAASGESVTFGLRAFDANGDPVAVPEDSQWSLRGLGGTIADGTYSADAEHNEGGMVVANAGGLEAVARVRVDAPLPWVEDFEGVEVGAMPFTWRPGFKGAAVQVDEDDEANKVYVQPKALRGAPRSFAYLGSASMSGYTVQADVKGNKKGRRFTDLGLINSGYTLDLQGGHQRLQVRSWSSERRMAQQQDFAWEIGVWYTIKLRVDIVTDDAGKDKALIRGKVWKRAETEPEAWSITVEDPLPIHHGSPGIYTFAPVPSTFDNVKVTASK